jgi:hypothetical protein
MGKDNERAQHGRVLVINPNSTGAVTQGIDAAIAPFRFADGPAFDCVTLPEGLPGIETQRHVDSVVGPICSLIAREDNAADAFVIARFSDPGLLSARKTTRKPVFGRARPVERDRPCLRAVRRYALLCWRTGWAACRPVRSRFAPWHAPCVVLSFRRNLSWRAPTPFQIWV